MTPERYAQIEQIFNAALDLQSADRPAFLDQACKGDELLRNEVDALLATHSLPENLIDRPAIDIAAKILAEAQARSLLGQKIGIYEVRSVLGAGGMGEVFLADDIKLGRKVALKLLPRIFTNDIGRVRRFEQEARSASALNHPNILTIYEIGEQDGTHFIATEYIEGETLRRLLDRGALEFIQAIDVAIQISAALAAAHRVGIIHRDIKPENIMLRPDGYVKVLDFGLAKLLPTNTQVKGILASSTATGVILGTAQYMSPEQARGFQLDARTDIFNLGIVFYEMLTGHVPFDGETASHTIVAILEKEPPPLRYYLPEAPLDLQSIVTKSLCKDPEDRFQTAEGVMDRLKNFKGRLNADNVSRFRILKYKRATGRGGHLADTIRRNRVALSLVASLFIGALFFLAIRPHKNSIVGTSFPTVNESGSRPVISSIFPPSPVDVIGDQDILVLGTNFQENMKINVTFPNGGTGMLCCTQIVRQSTTSVLILIDLNNNPGKYGIQIVDPDNGSSNPFFFTAQHRVEDPHVVLIVPNKPLATKEEQSIQVYGHSFQKGLTVRITFPDGQSAILSGRQIPEQTNSSFRILVYFDGARGAYKMQAINPNGRKSNVISFRVI